MARTTAPVESPAASWRNYWFTVASLAEPNARKGMLNGHAATDPEMVAAVISSLEFGAKWF